MQQLVSDLMLELRELDKRIAAFDREFAELSRSNEIIRSLLSIPGVGVINATAIGAAIGVGRRSRKGATSLRGSGSSPVK